MYQERHQRSVNRPEALLSRCWPEAEGLLDPASATLAALTARYGSPERTARCAEEAEALMRCTGGLFLSEEKIRLATQSARATLGAPCIETVRTGLMALGPEVMRAHNAIAEIKNTIEKKAASDAVLSRIGAVTGKAAAAVLTAESGSPPDYPNACVALKL